MHYGLSTRIQLREKEEQCIMDKTTIGSMEDLFIDDAPAGQAGGFVKADEKASLYTFIKALKSYENTFHFLHNLIPENPA